MKIPISSTKAVFLSLFMVATTAGLVLLGLGGSMSVPNSATPRPIVSSQSKPRTTEQVREAYGQVPLSFEANRGQADELVNFRARGAGYTLSLSPTEAVFVLGRGSEEASPALLRMNLVGGNSSAAVEGVNELEGRVNYLIGNDPARWRTNVPTFGRVRYSEVYPGIDVVYYGNQRRLEYDFVVAPGRDARAIALEFAGAERVEVETGTGDLLLDVGGKTIRQHKPVVYQEIEGKRREIEGRYAFRSGDRVGFEVGHYDPSATLIIDPVLEYSTYLGGSGVDYAAAIAVDSAGNAYVVGGTDSTNFPTANGLQSTPGGGDLNDVFVTKLNAAGTALVYSTYLGGSKNDLGSGIAVDSAGNAYITGLTGSTDFPTANAFQSTKNGGSNDAFVTKLNPAGSALVYSTFLGGSSTDAGESIAVDSDGNAYVTGVAFSTDFPIANAFQSTNSGSANTRSDAFITKLNAAGSALVYSTYLGGGGIEHGRSIAVDSAGNAYVTGLTSSTNFPIANAFQSTNSGGSVPPYEAFVTKLNAAGSALIYSTYLGGSELDQGFGIAVDSAGNAYVTGQTLSTNFPTANAFQSTNGGGDPFPSDAFVTKFNAAGSALVYSTYLGGSDFDSGLAIAVDLAGNAYVTGRAGPTGFPTANALQSTGGGGDDAYVTKLNAAGAALVYSTYLGGSESDVGRGIAVDSAGNAYVAGYTDSSCFPTTTGAFDPTPNGATDAFISKISETAPPSALTPCPSQLLNIATRMRVLTGDSALIGGFIITGSDPKRVIIRGIGPSLSGLGVQGALANPTLELLDANQTSLGSNDDWISNRAEVEATTIPPTNDFESAIVMTLAPGAYTAVLRGKDNSSGIGVVEVYDLNAEVRSTLANISSRGFVDTGDNAMIAGLIIGGSGQADSKIVVRGIGPSLSAFGINGALQDPMLDLKDANGATLLSNDDWQQGQPTEITQLGLAPSDSRESALLISLPHGIFTAVLRGKSNTIGVAVVEIYNVP